MNSIRRRPDTRPEQADLLAAWESLAPKVDEVRRLAGRVSLHPALFADPMVDAQVKWLWAFERELRDVQTVCEAALRARLAPETLLAATGVCHQLDAQLDQVRERAARTAAGPRPCKLPEQAPALAADGLQLMAVTEELAQALAVLATDDEVVRYFYEPGELPGRWEYDAGSWAFERDFRWATATAADFVLVADGQPVGWCALHHLDWELRHGTVGFWLGAEARGHAYAATAARLLCDWGFDDLLLERISAQADISNRPSRRALERAGFRLEGALRSWKERDGRRVDQVLYSRLPSDRD